MKRTSRSSWRLPDERRIAEAYSRGFPAVEALPGMRDLFEGLGARIVEEAEAHRAAAKPTGSPTECVSLSW